MSVLLFIIPIGSTAQYSVSPSVRKKQLMLSAESVCAHCQIRISCNPTALDAIDKNSLFVRESIGNAALSVKTILVTK